MAERCAQAVEFVFEFPTFGGVLDLGKQGNGVRVDFCCSVPKRSAGPTIRRGTLKAEFQSIADNQDEVPIRLGTEFSEFG